MQYDDAIKNRLRRIEGQIHGVANMIEQNKNCKDVVTQLSAVRSAVDRAIGLIVANNLAECIRMDMEKGIIPDKAIQEAVDLLVKSR
ncbi:metal-sensitive transcriptional regulator [Fodinisporobacter ferrooxydans]|uniref:Metal-sensitive transcriptional regulator n=1 Tax=Fodinisporobacter ferrooxydans TaxID=2901836 RepID=A0ABY4CHH2_9BACL|nr:metal-sensitive transcriptional regulator [Alicyclobacillaceae bacterium MYW30-H2]